MNIITVTEANDQLLFEVRLAVDGPFEELAEVTKVQREALRYGAQIDDTQAFLAIENGMCVGYVEVMLSEPTYHVGAPADKLDGLVELAHIARIGLTETARGKGIATTLLTHAEGWIKLKGKTGMWLGYALKNKPAGKLYSRFGFANLVEFEDPIKKRMRRIVMKKW